MPERVEPDTFLDSGAFCCWPDVSPQNVFGPVRLYATFCPGLRKSNLPADCKRRACASSAVHQQGRRPTEEACVMPPFSLRRSADERCCDSRQFHLHRSEHLPTSAPAVHSRAFPSPLQETQAYGTVPRVLQLVL